MNVFQQILNNEIHLRTSLGNPLGVGSPGYDARMNYFATARSGKGFRQPSMKVKVGNKRREARKRVFGLA